MLVGSTLLFSLGSTYLVLPLKDLSVCGKVLGASWGYVVVSSPNSCTINEATV